MREAIQNQIVDHLTARNRFDAPYGILTGRTEDKRARTVTFGMSRTLDASVDIYGPSFLVLRWQTAIRSLPPHGREKFTSVASLLEFIDTNF